MAQRQTGFDADNLVSRYLDGTSVKQLANDFGFSRSVVYRILRERGIPARNRSEAMYVRMAHTSKEERQRLASAAHEAKRGKANTPEMLHKRALAHKRFIGMFESEFIEAIKNSGIPVTPQEPFLSYNLDIGCGDIAVEIHRHTDSPLAPHHINRLMNCVNAGKSMLYVWISPCKNIVTDICYKQVITILKTFRSNPPSRSKYWVIRGTGELYASGSFDGD